MKDFPNAPLNENARLNAPLNARLNRAVLLNVPLKSTHNTTQSQRYLMGLGEKLCDKASKSSQRPSESSQRSGESSQRSGDNEKFAEWVEMTLPTAIRSDAKENMRRILMLIHQNPSMTADVMSKDIGITARGIQKILASLQKMGLVRHDGPKLGGRWEIVRPLS